ncbi:MAG: hypothetical protein ACREPM_18165 [Gemmatimonadaceae bacterium]
MNAARTLLGGIVDYAGLFPPAALDMPAAVRNYASYLADSDAWMLGRFVVAIARLPELADELPRAPDRPWSLTALAGADVEHDVESARQFNARHAGRAAIDVLELKAVSIEGIERIAVTVDAHFTTFVELSVSANLEASVARLRHHRLCAKIRTGGVVADAFPSAEVVARFIRACLREGVPFKATAGLHHPIRAAYRLTYDAGAANGVMFGYLNVFLAAALMANGLSDAAAERLLEERDAAAFELGDDRVGWRGHSLSADDARRVRERVAVSFGSCSFREPVDELKALALAPI